MTSLQKLCLLQVGVQVHLYIGKQRTVFLQNAIFELHLSCLKSAIFVLFISFIYKFTEFIDTSAFIITIIVTKTNPVSGKETIISYYSNQKVSLISEYKIESQVQQMYPLKTQ